ncbi:DUF6777 domain-containing protein [Streptomyces sp. CBMA152]|uniref:DUF6777 domain-containing protein n=1 Tax=Streptomyces sp. CBMA152 TaxID=1896312 RepID=UPI001660F04A|nr:DUF6777 domain-containing protein [Streptomyces sp. CBMA152]MBD0741775.1 hypothetical protein [Streptomyces sp. CBMA152]
MRSTPRRFSLAATVMSIAVLVAACGSGSSGNSASDQKELFLQPVAAAGPDPFTESTAKSAKPLTPSQPPPSAPSPSAPVQAIHSVPGSTPGLYGGTQSVASCDVEQQIRFLDADKAKARAFSETAGINQNDLPSFLRGLTPVVLRADTRVTNHGFKDGHATAFQSVLQAGTAVMVDDHGIPRVRCACGNPLNPPVATQGAASRGQSWPGYQPQRTVVINRTTTVINSLIIVNIINNTWIERRRGDNGARDRDRPDIQIDPTAPVVPESPSPVTPVSPEQSSPGTSPSESSASPNSPSASTGTNCPPGTPTTTVTQSPPGVAPGGTPPNAAATPGGTTPNVAATPNAATTPSGCPTATVTVSPKLTTQPPSPRTPSTLPPTQPLVPTPSTELPTLPSEPPPVFPQEPSSGSGSTEMPTGTSDFDTEPPLDARQLT